MQKILFTVNRIRPQKNVLHYAVQLCIRMKCPLLILQIINPQKCKSLLSNTYKKIHRAQRFLESTLTAAAYAQAGADEWARQCLEEGRRELEELLFIPQEAGVPCTVDQACGPLVKRLPAFLKSHPEVVMTVLDGQEGVSDRSRSSKIRLLQRKIPSQLGIPLIIPQNAFISEESSHETLE
jgi:hypothetical protein